MSELTLRSQTSSWPCPFPRSNHTRNLPPVSGVLSGMRVIDLIAGVGKVRNNSVWIHVARGALHHIQLDSTPPYQRASGMIFTIYIDRRIR